MPALLDNIQQHLCFERRYNDPGVFSKHRPHGLVKVQP
jgi:hypothetical protein